MFLLQKKTFIGHCNTNSMFLLQMITNRENNHWMFRTDFGYFLVAYLRLSMVLFTFLSTKNKLNSFLRTFQGLPGLPGRMETFEDMTEAVQNEHRERFRVLLHCNSCMQYTFLFTFNFEKMFVLSFKMF